MPNKHTTTLTLVALFSQDTPENTRKKGKKKYFYSIIVYKNELVNILKYIHINPILDNHPTKGMCYYLTR